MTSERAYGKETGANTQMTNECGTLFDWGVLWQQSQIEFLGRIIPKFGNKFLVIGTFALLRRHRLKIHWRAVIIFVCAATAEFWCLSPLLWAFLIMQITFSHFMFVAIYLSRLLYASFFFGSSVLYSEQIKMWILNRIIYREFILYSSSHSLTLILQRNPPFKILHHFPAAENSIINWITGNIIKADWKYWIMHTWNDYHDEMGIWLWLWIWEYNKKNRFLYVTHHICILMEK